MKLRRHEVSHAAEQRYAADKDLAARFGELLAASRDAEQALRDAQLRGAPLEEQRALDDAFTHALTAVMRAAYAAERAEIGPRGYEDRIYRRKAKATTAVRAWSAEAERLLTLREAHLLDKFRPGAYDYAG